MLANSHNAHTLCCDPPAAWGATTWGNASCARAPLRCCCCCLPHAHTHVRALSYYLLAAVSVLLPASAHLHNSNMAFLSSLSSLARAAAVVAAPVGGGHIKAFTWQHIQLHAICINCLSLSPSHTLSVSFFCCCCLSA